MRSTLTRVGGAGAAVALALTLAACGSTHSASSGSASASPSASKAVATIPNLTGVHTQVILSPTFVKTLTALHVTPGTVGSATLDASTGTVSFPITGGNVTYYTPGSRSPYVVGNILHNGSGISLTAGATTVSLTNFDVNPGTSELTGDVAVDGKSFAKGIELFFLDGSTLQPLQVNQPASGEATLYGTQVKIAPDAAAALSKVFKATIPAYFLVGTARIVVKV
jgi:hypothetical protein